jgi:REP element-mobilizing transposase RayT
VNSFEYVATETEQAHLDQQESHSILRTSLLVPDSETKLEEQTSIPIAAVEKNLEEQFSIPVFDLETNLESQIAAPTPASEINLEDVSATLMEAGDNQVVEFEPVQQISYQLSYSCLLIPRFSDHYLSGDITEDLPRWIKQICISYDWRLGEIMIRPGYLQWVITVPLTVSPAQFMRITRQQTSLKILEDYPRFKRQNLSGDFWAPGFSVAPGNQFQSMENVNSFILQTRRNQGIS